MFYLFAGYNYYPEGGVFDFQGYSPTLEDAKLWLAGLHDLNRNFDWWHITNEKMEIVASSSPQEVGA